MVSECKTQRKSGKHRERARETERQRETNLPYKQKRQGQLT